jgi:hypothetical protein
MCQFSQADNKAVLFVNAAAVRIVKTNRSGGTDIIFDDRQAVAVAEKPEEVVKRLEEAR